MVPILQGTDSASTNTLDELSEEEEEEELSSSSNQRQESHVPSARDHSYLLGSSQLPLRSVSTRSVHEVDQPSSQDQHHHYDQRTPPQQRERIFQLPILPLYGVVLFPGSTLPVKLRDRSMIRCLVPQLMESSSRRRRRRYCYPSSSSSPEEVRLGVITLDDESAVMIRRYQQHHRVSTTTTTTTTPPLVGTIATIQYTTLQQHDQTPPIEEEEEEQQQEAEDIPRNGGRVRMNNDNDSAPLINHPQENTTTTTTTMDELIFTAVGTGRFEFMEVISEQDPMIWKVRELVDDGPLSTYPPIIRQRLWSSGPPDTRMPHREDHDDNDEDEDDNCSHEEETTRQCRKIRTHDQVTWNLSLVTPLPQFVYQRYWPWKLVDELVTLLNHQNNIGETTNLPHLDLTGEKTGGGGLSSMSLSSPMEFSYYLAGNMPFTQNQRLELLRMPSTLERLLAIRLKVLKLVNQHQTQYLGCAQCELPLCAVRDVFSFEGAEGTTANYVNGHGYIHQVTTIRNVLNHRYIYCEGAASTENRYAFVVVGAVVVEPAYAATFQNDSQLPLLLLT